MISSMQYLKKLINLYSRNNHGFHFGNDDALSDSDHNLFFDISFTAPLIHRSSPESPFSDPNATPLDIIKASVRSLVPRIDPISQYYVIKYGIGSPPMDTSGVPDTGSCLTRLQCKGIVGLTNHKSSLVGQLDFSSFSYCVSANESFHGQMRFGSAAIVSGPSTKIAPNQAGNYYFQNVEGLYVDGEKVEGIPDWVFKFVESSPGAGGFLIDTGSSVSVFPSVAFDPLIEKLKKHMRSRGIVPKIDETGNFKLCYDIKYLHTQVLPAIEIRFTDMSESLMLSDANAWIIIYA
ncbi:hypothetical protein QYF36_009879 [Acer negundo]|nr:hypothetical protein QYF36_009879 [Acer negundo]